MFGDVGVYWRFEQFLDLVTHDGEFYLFIIISI